MRPCILRPLVAALSLSLPLLAQAQKTALPVPLDKPLNQLTWTATHNAFAHSTYIARNQDKDIRTQLDDGVGALMLDLWEHEGRVYLCHTACTSLINTRIRTFADVLNADILPHLRNRPNAILTLFLEDYVSPDKVQAELDAVSGLAGMTFDPSQWPDSREWPTIGQLVARGQRLLIFTGSRSIAGDYNVPGGKATFMFGQDGTVENYWSLGDTIFEHDWSCRTRWGHIPLDAKHVDFRGKSWPPLFVMNQFHGLSQTLHARSDNNLSNLWMRVESQCRAPSGKTPNFIAVDFYHQGDALEYAATLNHGGIVLWEGQNATEDAVCAIPYTGDPLRFSFKDDNAPIKGCENDEASSATLLNLKAGSTFTVFDSPHESRQDDWTTVLVKRDIVRVDLGSFEQNVDNADIRVTHHRYNGLDGKVSFVSLAPEAPALAAPSRK